MANASLDQNLQQQGLDPFAQARQMQADRDAAPAAASAMNSPFDQTAAVPQEQQQAQLSQVLPVDQSQQAFQDLAKQMSVDTSGLSSNPGLSRLQLTGRLQQQFGPGFQQQQGVPDLLKAHDAMHAANPYQLDQAKSDSKLTSQASRTLKALMG